MPSRKRDSRRSDASATSVSMNDEDIDESTAVDAPPPEQTSAGPAASPSMAPPAWPDSVEKGSSERKDKDKEKEREAVNIEDLTLPKSIITRLAKGVLPPNTQIQANAITAISKSAIVFVNHLAAAANELTMASSKRTVMPEDVFRALDEVEYGFMREKLEAEFTKFSSIQSSKRSSYRKKVAAAKKASTGGDTSVLSTASAIPDDSEDLGAGAGGGALQPRAKKAKMGGDESRDTSRMDVDEHGISDAETIPDEPEEEADEDEPEDDVDDVDDEDGEERDGEEANGDGLDDDEGVDVIGDEGEDVIDEALDDDQSE